MKVEIADIDVDGDGQSDEVLRTMVPEGICDLQPQLLFFEAGTGKPLRSTDGAQHRSGDIFLFQGRAYAVTIQFSSWADRYRDDLGEEYTTIAKKAKRFVTVREAQYLTLPDAVCEAAYQ